MNFVFLPLFLIVSFGRLLMLNFQPCRPATCYLICCIGLLCTQQINDDDDDDIAL